MHLKHAKKLHLNSLRVLTNKACIIVMTLQKLVQIVKALNHHSACMNSLQQ